jgi:hypothetical protein
MKTQKMKTSDLKPNFGGKSAPKDEKFIQLFQQVIKGTIPFYQADIKITAIKPFSTFVPSISQEFLDIVHKSYMLGNPPKIHVYQEDNKFIMSDDYNHFYIYKLLDLEVVPCYIMGDFDIKDVSKSEKVKLVVTEAGTIDVVIIDDVKN